MEGNGSKIALVAVAAIVIIGGGIFLATNKDDKKDSSSTSQTQSTQPAAKVTIVKVASDTPTLSTLVTAVKAADLVQTLQSEGPFTVFAPTNAAFDALRAGTLDTLLKPENKDQLASILKYHVVSGKVLAADLKDGQIVTTVQGENLTVKLTDGMAYLIDAKGNQIKIVKTDIDAGNGVVHVVDGVLLPS
ncbi:MAG: hypothetical protein QG628_791 [Patescibacteria group bacterium]|nr:hypothetical protein [Patescibacteria group bacterium]